MKNVGLILLYMIMGGASFWTLDIIVNYAMGRHQGHLGLHAATLTILLPLVVLTCYRGLYWFGGKQIKGPSIAIFMLLGIWTLGPVILKLYGVDYTWSWIALYTIMPIYTFIISTYHGSLGGLLLASILLVLIRFSFERKHRILPINLP